MVKETQLYDLLEVSTEADEQEIRRAYKTLALKYHPDKQPTSNDEDREKMTEMFKAVSKAYDILSDSNKRYLYDTYGEEVAANPQEQTSVFSTDNHHYDHNARNFPYHRHHQQHHYSNGQDHQSHGPGFPSAFSVHDMMNSHFSNTNEIFNHIFNDFGTTNLMNKIGTPFGTFGNDNNNFHQDRNNNRNHNSSNHNNGLVKGKDIMDTVYCSLLDYYNGKHIKMSLCKRVKCPKCKGSGGLKVYTCNDCCGSGYIINESRNGMMYQRTQSTCGRCQGTGEFIPAKYICDECGGNKLVDTKVIFDVRSPRGVSDGYRVVFPNAADEGVKIIPGDVVLTFKDDPNDKILKYKRFGNDLLTTISIPLVKALCGGRISLNHIDGKQINIFVACGEIKSASELKVLKGYGMPIHEPSSSSKPDSVNNNKNKRENKGNTKSENTSGNMSNNAENNNDNEDNSDEDMEYGDLIIKFDISFPDITAFSSKRVDLLSKVLGSNFPSESIQLGGVSSSSSSDDIPSSADDLSSFRMGSRNESSMSSLAKNMKLSDSDTNSGNIDLSKKRVFDAENDEIRYRSSTSDDGKVRSPSARAEKIAANAVRLQDLPDPKKRGLKLQDFPNVGADILYEELDLTKPKLTTSAAAAATAADITDAGENPYKRMKGNDFS